MQPTHLAENQQPGWAGQILLTRSNMSKACQSLAEAEFTVKFYRDKDGTEAEIKEEHGVWKVFRKSDNKVLKSINYSPADLVSILK
jgi:hypothetical protein